MAAQVSIDFGGVATAIWEFWADFGTTIVFFGMRVCRSRFFMILGLNLDVWGSRIKHLVWKVLQKTAFHICWDYVDLGVVFPWSSMALGPILVTFGGSGAGLKLYDFRWLSGEPQTGGRSAKRGCLVLSLGPIPSAKQLPGAI